MATVLLLPTASAKANKVDVCHATGNGSYHLINISEKAVAKHMANHGDGLRGDAVPGMTGYSFDDDCAPVADPVPEVIYAVAYTDVNEDGGDYDPANDVLIAKLVEASGDSVLSAGDQVVTNQYPLGFDFGTAGFDDFTVLSHTLTSVEVSGVGCFGAGVDPFSPPVFRFLDGEIEGEGYSIEGYEEITFAPSFAVTSIVDGFAGEWFDRILAGVDSPSQPETAHSEQTAVSVETDDPFIDVDLNCGT